MKKIFQLLNVLLFPLLVFGQDEYTARLSISGSVSELGISPSEEVWVATKAGNVYYTKQTGALWHIGPFGSLDPNNFSIGNTFERINFFSEDTLMISGFIQDQEGRKQDFVYWSGNHGKTWEKVTFGNSSWLDAAYINNHGKAWMSGSSQLIYYTENSGKTWTSFNKVEKTGNLRFLSAYFSKDEQTGLFGAWNIIYKTVNNCKSWVKLPTPLSQKKYQLLSKEDPPEIEKIRILENYYIVKQQGRVFITKSDVINWIYLPDVVDFDVTENGDLYTINSNLSIGLYNGNFTKTWQSEQKLESIPRAIGVRNNKLFALTSEYVYKINVNEFTSSQLLTNDTEIPEPYLKLSFGGQTFGFENRDILCFDETKKRWYRFMTLDFPISNATVFQNKLLVSNGNFNKYYAVDQNNKSIVEFKLPTNLFSDKNVTEIRFENGFQGCFSAGNSHRLYIKKSNKFIVDKDSSSSKYLPQSMNEIDEVTVQDIINAIENSRFTKVSLADLDISNEDIKEFKNFIDKEKLRIKKSSFDRFDLDNLYSFPGEYSDFDFYKSAADSLFNISEENINNAFWQTYGKWSTTTNWRRVIFIFQDGKKLIIENSDDKPNYLYTPWQIDYEGLKFTTNSIKFGRYIDEITSKQFFDKDARDKNYAIFKITDYLYRKKLQEK
jgi:hypothetical protein